MANIDSTDSYNDNSKSIRFEGRRRRDKNKNILDFCAKKKERNIVSLKLIGLDGKLAAPRNSCSH